MTLHEGIKKAVEMRTNSIVLDYQFINLLSDFQAFTEFPLGKSIIKRICSTNYIHNILNLYKNHNHLSEQSLFTEIDRIAYVMSGEYKDNFDLVRYCCESIAYGLGVLKDIEGYYTVDNFKHAPFIGYWNFEYELGKEVGLNIFRNYKALTSLNIEFNWKPVFDDEIELYIPGIISYRGTISNSVIEGIAKKEFYVGEWNWRATKKNYSFSEEYLIYSVWKLINENSEIDDFEFQILPKGLLNSKTKGEGRWYIDNKYLLLSISNGFLSFYVGFNEGNICGKGRNKLGQEWNIKLKQL